MATTSLLKVNPSIWKSNFSFPSPSSRLFPKNNLSFIKPTKFSKTFKSNSFTKFSIECFSTKHSKCEDTSSNASEVYSTSLRSKNDDTSKNPFELVANTILKSLEALKKPTVAAILMGFLLVYGPQLALAASGGRMGGSAFSSRSSSSSSSSRSSSYSYSFSRSSSKHSPTYLSDSLSSDEIFAICYVALICLIVAAAVYHGQHSYSSISVIKVQVGLLGTARSLQKDLNQIAEAADTSTVAGLSYILTETAVSLLRHPNYWISGYSSVNMKGNTESAEQLFNKLSVAERAKFDEETLVNVNNKKKKSTIEKFDEFNNEYIVVTILVAADRKRELPAINGSVDLMEALERLGSIPQSEIKAVEVLWTPQEENGTLSEQELHGDYPHLRPP